MQSELGHREFRIGVGSGFAGDRFDPGVDLARRADLNALVFECLAERTIALAQHRVLKGLGSGFDPLIVERVRQTTAYLQPNAAPIITNAGAADPVGGAMAIQEMLRQHGSANTRVAAITGDDVLSRLDLRVAQVWGTDKVLYDYKDRLVSANAYLGVEGILDALDEEPAVVITGRVSDAALFLAPLMHHFEWGLESLGTLAAGTVVGHLLECGGQLTGGYFADGDRKDVPGLARLGFPLADVSADGSCVISKLPGTGGRIDRSTTIEQLLYEVDDPTAYLTPDVTLDLSGIVVDDTGGPNTVRVHGAIGRPPPDNLKVTVGLADGYSCRAEISYAGEGCVRRAEMAAAIIEERWRDVHRLESIPLVVQFIGLNACRAFYDPQVPNPPEVRLALSVRSLEMEPATTLAREVEALYTNGPAGGGGVTARVAETVGTVSTTIPRSAVQPKMSVLS